MSAVFSKGSIKQISQSNSSQPLDCDNFRSKYIDVDKDNGITIFFPSFSFECLEKNRFILLNNSNTINFITRWNMRPDYASYDIYGTEIYWPIIMFLNNINCFEEFYELGEIVSPPLQSLIELTKDNIFKKTVNKLIDSEIIQYSINPAYLEQPNDKIDINRNDANYRLGNSGTKVKYINQNYIIPIEETIILSDLDIKHRYVDLQNEPANISTLTVFIFPYVNLPLKFNYDYTIIYNENNKLNRISWNPIDIANSSTNNLVIRTGLNGLAKSGIKIIIKYSINQVKKIKV